MDHCRGFLTGMFIGAIIVGPIAGASLVTLLVLRNPASMSTELGPLPFVCAGGWVGIPVGALVGAMCGSIVDWSRLRDSGSLLAAACTGLLALGVVSLVGIVAFG